MIIRLRILMIVVFSQYKFDFWMRLYCKKCLYKVAYWPAFYDADNFMDIVNYIFFFFGNPGKQ